MVIKFKCLKLSKKLMKRKNIKEHITPLSRDNTTQLQDDYFKDIGDINDLLIIEAGVTRINLKWSIEI